jgi:uncharacterized protein with HEPN domain
MATDDRNRFVLERMIWYCDEIDKTICYFGDSKENLLGNTVYKHALSMCVLQLGELTTLLSQDFKDTHTGAPWSDIKAMRNIAAHRYGEFSIDFLWDTVKADIEPLREYCENCISEIDASRIAEEDTEKNAE